MKMNINDTDTMINDQKSPKDLQVNSLSRNLGSFECFLRYWSGDGGSSFAGPIVRIASLFNFVSCTTLGLYLDIYLQIQHNGGKQQVHFKCIE